MSRPMSEKDRIICYQQELIHKLSWNPKMGCFNRYGFEYTVWPEKCTDARHLIYFDVNGVHALNDLHQTYDVFDAKIKQVWSAIRSTDVVAGQWNSGDEFLVAMIETPGNQRRHNMNPQGLMDRLIAELAKQDLTAEFVIIEVTSYNLEEIVKPAADHVLAVKHLRGETR